MNQDQNFSYGYDNIDTYKTTQKAERRSTLWKYF